MPSKPPVATVYLARAQNGLAPFQNFLRSYARFPGGMPNDLVIVFKGFKSVQETAAYDLEAARFSPAKLFMRDFGFDLRAYGLAARQFDYSHFCFLNSFSEILAPDWLAKMYTFIGRKGVGLVGATGSHESMYSNAFQEHCRGCHRPFSVRLRAAIRVRLCRLCFEPFPNYHLRTNAFLISRELMLRIWPRLVLTKRGAYLFESGKNSLTRRALRAQRKPLVVGRDGLAYERFQWPQSNTFRQGSQKNLLVGDNQTRQFAEANRETQLWLSKVTWGDAADSA